MKSQLPQFSITSIDISVYKPARNSQLRPMDTMTHNTLAAHPAPSDCGPESPSIATKQAFLITLSSLCLLFLLVNVSYALMHFRNLKQHGYKRSIILTIIVQACFTVPQIVNFVLDYGVFVVQGKCSDVEYFDFKVVHQFCQELFNLLTFLIYSYFGFQLINISIIMDRALTNETQITQQIMRAWRVARVLLALMITSAVLFYACYVALYFLTGGAGSDSSGMAPVVLQIVLSGLVVLVKCPIKILIYGRFVVLAVNIRTRMSDVIGQKQFLAIVFINVWSIV